MKKLLISFLILAMMLSLFACAGKNNESSKEPTEKVTVVAPDGAPALSLAYLMNQNSDKYDFEIVDSSTISTYVTGTDPKADICILPVNLASKLLGKGDVYQMLGVVTHGNLFLLSQDSQTVYTAENLSALVGKTVGVIQLANVPGLTFKTVLNKNNVPWKEMGNSDEVDPEKVNLKALADASEVIPGGGCDVYLAPEPAASLKVSKTPLAFVGNIQSLYGGDKGYPQAVVVAKKQLAEEYKNFVSDFIKGLSDTSSWLADSESSVIVSAINSHVTQGMTPSLNENNLSKEAIANSGVWFTPSSECKQEVIDFLSLVISINSNAGAVPEDNFFYNGK